MSEGEEQRVSGTAGAAEAGRRLDAHLAAAWPDLSRSRLKQLVLAGRVALAPPAGAGTITDPSYRVKQGQSFAILIPQPEAAEPEAQAIPLAIVHEDGEVIVVDKPAGLVVHPAPGNPDRTLVNALIAHCGASLSGIGGVRRPGIVHRLDKDTSGLMVAAKTDRAHAVLSEQFAAHSLHRAYLAIVWGRPSPAAGEIEAPIGRSPWNRKKMAVVGRGGRRALTRYRVLRPVGAAASLVECRLATGRTHQIRVHMAHLGHPLVGDPVYGGGTAARLRRLEPCIARDVESGIAEFARQALHARLIGFRHPDGRWLEFESRMPDDMERLARILELIQ